MGGLERPIDLDHLDRYTGGDRAINEEILQLFDNQCHEMLDRLQHLIDERALDAGLAQSWREITHTLKGAARGIGAFALADAAAEAEKSGAERKRAIAALERLKCKSAAVQGFIEEFLARNG